MSATVEELPLLCVTWLVAFGDLYVALLFTAEALLSAAGRRQRARTDTRDELTRIRMEAGASVQRIDAAHARAQILIRDASDRQAGVSQHSGGWLDRVVGGCFSVLIGAVALYCAVRLIESILPALIVVGGVLALIALIVGGFVVIRTLRDRW
jgi:hypothetical protein